MAEEMAAFETDVDNVEAWRLFHRAVTRFTMDTHTVPVVLARLTDDMEETQFTELIERFTILYAVFCPPLEKPNAED